MLPWLLTTALAADPAWVRHDVPTTPVSVELPGTIEVRHAERSMVIGTVVSETIVVLLPDGWAAATVTTIPTAAAALATTGSIFGTTRKSVLGDHEGTQESWTDVKRGGHDGKRLVFVPGAPKRGSTRGTSEIYTWDDRVATITVMWGPATPQTTIDRIFGSIRLPAP